MLKHGGTGNESEGGDTHVFEDWFMADGYPDALPHIKGTQEASNSSTRANVVPHAPVAQTEQLVYVISDGCKFLNQLGRDCNLVCRFGARYSLLACLNFLVYNSIFSCVCCWFIFKDISLQSSRISITTGINAVVNSVSSKNDKSGYRSTLLLKI